MAQNVFAVDFKCRSYNTGNLLDYRDNTRTLLYKDRFGNELNAWSNLDRVEESNVITYFYDTKKIISVDMLKESADVSFVEDDSYQCRFITQ